MEDQGASEHLSKSTYIENYFFSQRDERSRGVAREYCTSGQFIVIFRLQAEMYAL